MLLKGQLALVTGASRGIGQAIALELGRLGAQVIGTATSSDGAQKISAALKEKGVAGKGMMLDVNSAESIAAVLSEIEKSGGAPTILVNNAGITRANLLLRMSKACLRAMTKARSGRIISISSVVGAIGNAGQVNYAAAKAGLIGFTKAL